jgi:nicotinamide mononucleotide (NMN) deamidase PncC
MSSLIEEVVGKLKSKDLTISTCEFYTGGSIALMLNQNNPQFRGGLILRESLIPLFFNIKQVHNFDVSSVNTNNFLALQTVNKFKTDLSICISELFGNKIILSICVIDKTYHKEIVINSSTIEDIKLDVCYKTLTELSGLLKD